MASCIMFNVLRSIIFNVFLWLWTIVVALCFVPLLLTPPKIVLWVAYIWSKGILIALRFICGIRYSIEGWEYLPPAPYIIAAKHQSAWDTIVLLAELPKVSYILKKELLWLPFFGWYLSSMGMISIDRKQGKKALKAMLKKTNKRLKEKHIIVVFPEGTRTAPGSSKPYQRGIAALYEASQVPIVPVALNSGCFWGKNAFFKKPGVIKMCFLPPIAPGLKRAELMVKLEKEIEAASLTLLPSG